MICAPWFRNGRCTFSYVSIDTECGYCVSGTPLLVQTKLHGYRRQEKKMHGTKASCMLYTTSGISTIKLYVRKQKTTSPDQCFCLLGVIATLYKGKGQLQLHSLGWLLLSHATTPYKLRHLVVKAPRVVIPARTPSLITCVCEQCL